jgi:protein gp37
MCTSWLLLWRCPINKRLRHSEYDYESKKNDINLTQTATEETMAKETSISWTNHTFNPWWGCTKVSKGCDHCYAATYANRYGFKWGPAAQRRLLGENHWNEPLKWDKQAGKEGVRHRVFCASMADVFEDNQQVLSQRMKLWALVEATPNLDWQLLTKRPQKVKSMVPKAWLEGSWPSNVWVGTSVENQDTADRRIPELLRIPAPIKFLSCEPLLGQVSLDGVGEGDIQWLIVGGESGPGARPMDVEWARDLRDQCQERNISMFVKQMGGGRDKRQDMVDLPEDLRIREFPAPG